MAQHQTSTSNSNLAMQIQDKNPAAGKLGVVDYFKAAKDVLVRKLMDPFAGNEAEARRLYLAFTHSVSCSTDLLECTTESLVHSLMQCAQLGLYPGPFQEAAIVSYKKKKVIDGKDTWCKEAQFIPQYQGLVKLGKQAGFIVDIHANVVYEKDEFDFEEGSKKYLRHRRALVADRGNRVAAYACATLANGGSEFIVMAPHEIESIKKRSRSASSDYSPWTTDTDQMWKKTAIKQLCKLIPKQGEAGERLANALEADNEIERPDLRKTPIVEFDVTPSNPTPEASAGIAGEK